MKFLSYFKYIILFLIKGIYAFYKFGNDLIKN